MALKPSLTPSGIITVGLVCKRSVDISTENFSIALEEIISPIDPNIKTYIMSDLNINLLDYGTSPRVENVLILMIYRNYCPVITRKTRVTPISCTLIDNIFSNRVDEIESSGIITTNISDHYPIFSRELRPSLADNVLSINYRVFSEENLSNFINTFQYTNWEPILNNDDANESDKLFQSTLHSLFNDHFPLHTKNF